MTSEDYYNSEKKVNFKNPNRVDFARLVEEDPKISEQIENPQQENGFREQWRKIAEKLPFTNSENSALENCLTDSEEDAPPVKTDLEKSIKLKNRLKKFVGILSLISILNSGSPSQSQEQNANFNTQTNTINQDSRSKSFGSVNDFLTEILDTKKEERESEIKKAYEQGDFLGITLQSYANKNEDVNSANFSNFLETVGYDGKKSRYAREMIESEKLLTEEQWEEIGSQYLTDVVVQLKEVETEVPDYHLLVRKILVESGYNNIGPNDEQSKMILLVQEANYRAIKRLNPEEVDYLYQRCGMINFFRYRTQDLKRQVEILQAVDQREDLPINGYVLHIFAQADYNRVFDSHSHRQDYQAVEAHQQDYPLIIVEAHDYNSFFHQVKNMHQKLGSADIVFIEAHGNKHGFVLGYNQDGTAWNQVNIQNYLKNGNLLGKIIKKNGTLVLNSCATGNDQLNPEAKNGEKISLGPQLSINLSEVLVIAPDQSASPGKTQYYPTADGLKIAIRHQTARDEKDVTRYYLNGREIDLNDGLEIGPDYNEYAYQEPIKNNDSRLHQIPMSSGFIHRNEDL